MEIIYLDVSFENKTTDFGFKIKENNSIYFGIHDNIYVVDYDLVSSVTLNITTVNGLEYSFVINDIVEFNDARYFKWDIPLTLLQSSDKLTIIPIVRYKQANFTLDKFKLIIYELDEGEMNAIKQAIRNYNSLIKKYLDRLKRSDLDKVDGIIPLDENGLINPRYLPELLDEHIPQKLYDTLNSIQQIHGLRINRTTFEVEYYDSDDDYWYVVNSIHGGSFTRMNKSEQYDVFGGNFTDENPPEETNIFGGNF